MTHRAVIGSLRNSGKNSSRTLRAPLPQNCYQTDIVPRLGPVVPAEVRTPSSTAVKKPLKWVNPVSPAWSGFRAESSFVEADNGRDSGAVVDGDHIKTQRAIANVPVAKEIMRGANQYVMLLARDAQFRQRRLPFLGGSGAHLDEHQRVAVIADQVDSPLLCDGQ
jgi:hypothetical protein